MRRIAAFLMSVTVASAAFVAPAFAEWPERPVKLIVPFAAGSSSDTIARIVAAKASEKLGQQIVVENRVGASTIIGTDAVAKAAPDGYTLGLANTTTHAASAALNTSLPFDPVKDFIPVAMIGSSPFVLISAPQMPAKTLAEFVALAKAKPGALSYASAGTGTLAHLAGELFKRQAQVDITHVPYRGTAQSMIDLMQGRIELSVSTIPPTLQQIHEGKLRALAVMGEHRNGMLPEIPTVAEAGVPGCEAGLWTAIVVPAGTPDAIVKRLNGIMAAVAAASDVQQAMKIQGVDPEPGSPETVAERIKADVVKWKDVVKTAKIAGAQQ
ncbi:Bug family tripartite tricarboxylate transporter substrate binding protein [Rhodoplanes sp. Z2-YC6860]|uniref:Bug family tripartite tricarboxylate transporter substrate binding protein n=1 Tax=Rhodoplanes sp. Z2-YC6860 TaxID=674703 RepID=UPI00078E88CF|nr:tripartite tricarboxylate transporter substrate binding protein [Rhodoplanes sp. Z2-YC6860]AMN43897.1 extra-cytoplasmic solute receptor [Rhodoplanes sp. Z2-YC6860]